MSKSLIIAFIVIVVALASFKTYATFSQKSSTPPTSIIQSSTTESPTPQVASTSPIPFKQIPVVKSPSPTPKSSSFSSSVKLISLSPSTLNFGDELKLSGSGFGSNTGKVYLYNKIMGPNNVFSNVIPRAWSDSEIIITIPPVVGGQTIDVEIVHQDGTKSNRLQFFVKGGQPKIDNILPKGAQPLQNIEITGTGFGSNNGSIDIYQSNSTDYNTSYAKCEIGSWSDSSIKCRLPGGVESGKEYGFQIVSQDNRKSSLVYYKVGP